MKKVYSRLETTERGRFYVADEFIEVNDVILEEEAAVFIPGRNENNSVFICDNCAESDIVPFPCYDCRAAWYCSLNCREKHTSIHRFECNGYKVCLFDNLKQGHLAFRCLLAVFNRLLEELRGLTNGMEIRSASELWPIVLQTCKDGELLGLFNDFKLYQQNKNILKDTMLASLLCCYLSDQTDFFQRSHRERFNLMTSEFEWKVLVISLLLRFFVQVDCNSAAINQFLATNSFAKYSHTINNLYKTLELRYDAVGIHPNLSLLNHSCNSNTFLQHHNLKASLVCRTPIAKGAEITLDYIWDSARGSRDQRMNVLKDTYHFVCDCSRCTNEEAEICVRASGVDCECGGVCLLCNEDAACSKCGKNSNAEYYFNALTHSYIHNDSPETFIYLYGTYSMLKKSLAEKGVLILTEGAEYILTKYLSIPNIDRNEYEDEQINAFLVKIAVDVLKKTQYEYMHPLDRVKFAAMLLDILAIRKERGFPGIQLEYQAIIKETLGFITGKARKLFDEAYKLYCT